MSDSSQGAATRLHQIVNQFEDAWQQGQAPSIEEHLHQLPSTELELLVELVHVDLEHQLRLSNLVSIEDYFERYPELTQDEGVALDLIATELVCRRQREESVSLDEYIHRFPQWRESLLRHLDQRMQQEGLPTIPGYEIYHILGRGGMGVVYKARHLKLKRFVALKMIRADFGVSDEERDRFRREAEIIAQLQHPNVVQIFDIGEHEGQLYLTLDYVRGGTLAEILHREGPQNPDEAAKLIETISRAMSAVHDRGVIHRDLKPGNVLLGEGGSPRIADFGLAKTLDDDQAQTRTGQVVGTPAYLAPEQIDSKLGPIAPATDVHALGIILYEMLTGRPPFQGANEWATIEQVSTQEPVPPRKLTPGIPRDLETICLQCLRKEPRRRYLDAEELANDLRRFQNREPIRARRTGRLERGWLWCRRHPVVASLLLLVAVLALTAGGVYLAYRQQSSTLEQNQKLTRRQAEVILDDLDRRWKSTKESSKLLNDTERWRSLLDEARRALERANVDSPRLASRLRRHQQDFDFIEGIGEIQIYASQTRPEENRFSRPEAIPKYRALLKSFGIGPSLPDSEKILRSRPEMIRGRALAVIQQMIYADRLSKVAYLSKGEKEWMESLIDCVDPDPWRRQFRRAVATMDRQAMRRLVLEVKIEEQPPQSLIVNSVALFELNEIAMAFQLLKDALILHPDDYWIHSTLADLYRNGRWPQLPAAREHWLAALALRPRSPGAMMNLSMGYPSLGGTRTAVALLQRATDLSPRYPHAHVALGRRWEAFNQWDKAILAYETAIRLEKNHVEAHYCLARACQIMKKEQRAEKAFENLFALEPLHARGHTVRAQFHLARREWKLAEAHARFAQKGDAKLALAHDVLGEALIGQERDAEAIDSFQTALKYDERLGSAHFHLGRALLNQKKVDEAIQSLKLAIRYQPPLYEAYLQLASAWRQKGRLDQAITTLRNAAITYPRLYEFQRQLVLAWKENDELDQAKAHLKKYVIFPQIRARLLKEFPELNR